MTADAAQQGGYSQQSGGPVTFGGTAQQAIEKQAQNQANLKGLTTDQKRATNLSHSLDILPADKTATGGVVQRTLDSIPGSQAYYNKLWTNGAEESPATMQQLLAGNWNPDYIQMAGNKDQQRPWQSYITPMNAFTNASRGFTVEQANELAGIPGGQAWASPVMTAEQPAEEIPQPGFPSSPAGGTGGSSTGNTGGVGTGGGGGTSPTSSATKPATIFPSVNPVAAPIPTRPLTVNKGSNLFPNIVPLDTSSGWNQEIATAYGIDQKLLRPGETATNGLLEERARNAGYDLQPVMEYYNSLVPKKASSSTSSSGLTAEQAKATKIAQSMGLLSKSQTATGGTLDAILKKQPASVQQQYWSKYNA
jgi:hypothetical protein